MDVEGHEQKVMDGAQGMFAQGFRPLLVTEFAPLALKLRGECTYYQDLLSKYQYSAYIISHNTPNKTAQLMPVDLDNLKQIYKSADNPEIDEVSLLFDLLFVPPHMADQPIKPVV